MKDIVLAGVQASGKDTQALFLKEKGYEVFGAGQALREKVAVGDELGLEIKARIDGGDLVDDEMIGKVLADWLESVDSQKPIVYVGFPRSRGQYDIFQKIMADTGREAAAVIIDITDEEAVKRLTTRKVCPVCAKNFTASDSVCDVDGAELEQRADDSDMDAIKKRIGIYHETTAPVFDLFKEQGNLILVNGAQSVDLVTAEMFEKLGL